MENQPTHNKIIVPDRKPLAEKSAGTPLNMRQALIRDLMVAWVHSDTPIALPESVQSIAKIADEVLGVMDGE